MGKTGEVTEHKLRLKDFALETVINRSIFFPKHIIQICLLSLLLHKSDRLILCNYALCLNKSMFCQLMHGYKYIF